MKPIPNFPNYFASSAGKIFTTKRSGGTHANYPLKEMKYEETWDGYLRVKLTVDGKQVKKYVHRIILETFTGPPPEPSHQARHLNDKRNDNSIGNLAWGTASLNAKDKKALIEFLTNKYPTILEEFYTIRKIV